VSAGSEGYLASQIQEQQAQLIPRIIHQTYKTRKVKERHLAAVQSWQLNNPNWAYRFYDDTDCREFVVREFPQWIDAYVALPLAVERADFFRLRSPPPSLAHPQSIYLQTSQVVCKRPSILSQTGNRAIVPPSLILLAFSAFSF